VDRGSVISRYRILDRIAEGGMGEVYLAKMETLGGAEKVVALKLVRRDLAENEEFASLFIDEARLAMGLSHANIVQSFDAGRIDQQLFLAMEYVAGLHLGDLMHLCEQRLGQPLPHRHLIYIAVEALKGLDYAHRRVDSQDRALGVVHRDVSPGNILLSREGEVKVADFGIAKSALRSRQTTAGRVKGKLPYIAPEQLRQAGVDRRTDIYSLAAVMYEALTNCWLVDANDTERAIQDILEGRFARPRDTHPEIAEALEAIVLRALSTDPESRYSNAPAMRQELERFALAQGYLLSSADLADFVEELGVGARPSHAPKSTDLGLPPAVRAEPAANVEAAPFNALLGAELRKLDTADPYSVFTTDEVALLTAPPRSEPMTMSLPLRRRRRWLWVIALFGAAALITVVELRGEGEPTASVDVPEQPNVATVPLTAEPIAPQPQPQPRPQPQVSVSMEDAGPDPRQEPEIRPRPRVRRAARRPVPPAAPLEPAFVSINSDPWSYVVIDGKRIQTTPVRGYRIPPGRHEIVLRNPEAGLERRFEIEVQSGESKRLSVDLRGNP
jgi:serine/threonine-protein kinase